MMAAAFVPEPNKMPRTRSEAQIGEREDGKGPTRSLTDPLETSPASTSSAAAAGGGSSSGGAGAVAEGGSSDAVSARKSQPLSQASQPLSQASKDDLTIDIEPRNQQVPKLPGLSSSSPSKEAEGHLEGLSFKVGLV